MTHLTIAGNTAFPESASLYNRGTLALRNSIIAESIEGADCLTNVVLSENSGNLIEDGTCSPALSGDPLLGEAEGSPAYLPLEASSPAIGAADQAHCADVDQAGTVRPQGEACDIGAIEYAGEVVAVTDTPTPTVTPTQTPTATLTPTATVMPTDTATQTSN